MRARVMGGRNWRSAPVRARIEMRIFSSRVFPIGDAYPSG